MKRKNGKLGSQLDMAGEKISSIEKEMSEYLFDELHSPQNRSYYERNFSTYNRGMVAEFMCVAKKEFVSNKKDQAFKKFKSITLITILSALILAIITLIMNVVTFGFPGTFTIIASVICLYFVWYLPKLLKLQAKMDYSSFTKFNMTNLFMEDGALVEAPQLKIRFSLAPTLIVILFFCDIIFLLTGAPNANMALKVISIILDVIACSVSVASYFFLKKFVGSYDFVTYSFNGNILNVDYKTQEVTYKTR